MFERVIYNIIRDGVTYFTEEPRRLAAFMEFQRGLSDTESAALRTAFLAKPPRVQHGFANAESTMPTYCITLESESPSQHFLGDRGHTYVGRPDILESLGYTAGVVPTYSCIMTSTYTVTVAAENNPDMCIFLHEMLKFIITRAQLTWIAEGALRMDWSSGSVETSDRYGPHYVFERRVTLTLETEYLAPLPASDNLARSVAGLHVNSGRELGVSALIVPEVE